MDSIFSVVFESTPLFLTGVFVLGLFIGSFLNVVIHRLPAQLQHDWRCQCRELLEIEGTNEPPPPGLAKPRSRCPKCGHAIKAHENIPVLSYIFLKGKCAGCGARIPKRYPIVELLTAILFLVVGWHFGPTLACLAGLTLSSFLVALAGIDIDHQLLPDNITYPLLWAGLLFSLGDVFVSPSESILGAVVGYMSLWLIFQFFRLLTGKEGMGYGDFKLLAVFGAWFGWQSLLLIILISSLTGAIFGITMIVMSKNARSQPIPFGPYLAFAGWYYMMWGEATIDTYQKISGFG